jgi:anti-anti-sigma factor
MQWRAEVSRFGERATVALHGDLDLLVATSLRQTLNDVCEECRHLLLDLTDVRLIDSTGLGLLVRTHQAVKRKGGVVCLVAPSAFIQTVLFTMRLHPIFPIFPDLKAAEAWLSDTDGGSHSAHLPVGVE